MWSRILLLFVLFVTPLRATQGVLLDPQATPREVYGASKLTQVLESKGFRLPRNARIIAAVRSSQLFSGYPSRLPLAAESESFHILRAGKDWLIAGSDPSGVLYGCLELARIATTANSLPEKIDLVDRPAFRIRGTNLFWMKSGKILAELGSCNSLPKPGITAGQKDQAPLYLRELANNLLHWAQESTSDGKSSGGEGK
jgi:hypothetical protein